MNSGCHCRRLPGCSHHWLQGDPLDQLVKTGMLRTDNDSVISVDYQQLFLMTGDSAVISVWSRFWK